MKAIEKIKNREMVDVYCVEVYSEMRDSVDMYLFDEPCRAYGDLDEATAYHQKLVETLVAEEGETLHVYLQKVNVDGGEFEDEELEGLESHEDLYNLIGSDGYTIDYGVVFHYYDSVEGALLLEWRWNRYIGYSREYVGVRFGRYKETTELCLPIDRTFARQTSLILTADEIAELGDDALNVAYDRICEMGKWRIVSCAYKAIAELLGLDCEEEE